MVMGDLEPVVARAVCTVMCHDLFCMCTKSCIGIVNFLHELLKYSSCFFHFVLDFVVFALFLHFFSFFLCFLT